MFSMRRSLRERKSQRRRGSIGRLLQITPTHDSTLTPQITTQNVTWATEALKLELYTIQVLREHFFLKPS